MQKGIVLFDIKDFLYQGLPGQKFSVQEVNERQSQALQVLHAEMSREQHRRRSSNTPVPTVHIFLPTGDGYYLLPTLGEGPEGGGLGFEVGRRLEALGPLGAAEADLGSPNLNLLMLG